MPDEYQKKAAELAFDLTKQFLTLAFAGIAFVAGLSFNTSGSVSKIAIWSVIVSFGLSAVLGLTFLGHGVNRLSVKKTFDIYASSLRFLSILQIVFVLIGVGLLAPILNTRFPIRPQSDGQVEIRFNDGKSVSYPINPAGMRIEVDGNSLRVAPAAQDLKPK